jgi:hypothetical protein
VRALVKIRVQNAGRACRPPLLPAGHPGNNLHRDEKLYVNTYSHDGESDDRFQEFSDPGIAPHAAINKIRGSDSEESGERHQGKRVVAMNANDIARTKHHHSRRG